VRRKIFSNLPIFKGIQGTHIIIYNIVSMCINIIYLSAIYTFVREHYVLILNSVCILSK